MTLETSSETSITDEDHPLPVRNGDWVVRQNDLSYVAKVRSVWVDRGEVLMNIVLYAKTGVKIGRDSPALDGPRTFEPAVPYLGWRRIAEPHFPIVLRWLPNGDGRVTAGYHHGTNELPDRVWIPRRRKATGGGGHNNFNPAMEAAARRLAAQELRDMARQHNLPALIERAVALEREAEALQRG